MPVKLVVNGKEMDPAAAGFLALDEDAIHEWARAGGIAYDRTQQYVRLEVTVRKQRANDTEDGEKEEGRDGAVTVVETEHQTSGAEDANENAGKSDGSDSEPAKSAADAPRKQPKVSLAPRTATGEPAGGGTQKTTVMEGPQGFASDDPKKAVANDTQKRVGADPAVTDVDAKAKAKK